MSGLRAGDAIGIVDQAVTSATYNVSLNKLAVVGSDGSQYNLAFSGGAYQQGDFSVVGGVVDITCYVAGTRILTNCGEVSVEDLAVGDLVVTISGASVPIEWIWLPPSRLLSSSQAAQSLAGPRCHRSLWRGYAETRSIPVARSCRVR